jgi:hypothetical protein
MFRLISSLDSLNEVSYKSLSPSSHFPPGKLTSPECVETLADRCVNITSGFSINSS